jgi:hypothetical protein
MSEPEPSDPEPHRVTAPAPTKRCDSLRLRLCNTAHEIIGGLLIIFGKQEIPIVCSDHVDFSFQLHFNYLCQQDGRGGHGQVHQ